MGRDKQIEEMTKDLFSAYAINKLYTEDVAEYLYNAGYRMDNIKIGDKVICIISGVSGVVIKQYFPTACEQQTMVRCEDGRLYHAPTRTWRKKYTEEGK